MPYEYGWEKRSGWLDSSQERCTDRPNDHVQRRDVSKHAQSKLVQWRGKLFSYGATRAPAENPKHQATGRKGARAPIHSASRNWLITVNLLAMDDQSMLIDLLQCEMVCKRNCSAASRSAQTLAGITGPRADNNCKNATAMKQTTLAMVGGDGGWQ